MRARVRACMRTHASPHQKGVEKKLGHDVINPPSFFFALFFKLAFLIIFAPPKKKGEIQFPSCRSQIFPVYNIKNI
jgi:hypothetical protein